MNSLPNPQPKTLSASLADAADGFEADAADAIADGDPESAERTRRIAAHVRRLAFNHSAAATYQHDDTLDPEQVV